MEYTRNTKFQVSHENFAFYCNKTFSIVKCRTTSAGSEQCTANRSEQRNEHLCFEYSSTWQSPGRSIRTRSPTVAATINPNLQRINSLLSEIKSYELAIKFTCIAQRTPQPCFTFIPQAFRIIFSAIYSCNSASICSPRHYFK